MAPSLQTNHGLLYAALVVAERVEPVEPAELVCLAAALGRAGGEAVQRGLLHLQVHVEQRRGAQQLKHAHTVTDRAANAEHRSGCVGGLQRREGSAVVCGEDRLQRGQRHRRYLGVSWHIQLLNTSLETQRHEQLHAAQNTSELLL